MLWYKLVVMFSIGQLAKTATVSNRTLRYYEELGLIVPRTRGENRYRYYDESHLHRLQTIKMLQDSGFALKEIVAALSPMLDPSGNVTPSGQDMAKKIFVALEAQKNRLLERQKEIAKTVEEIQKTMTALSDCFGCKVASSLEDCAQCKTGPGEVRYLGQDFVDKNILKKAAMNGSNHHNHKEKLIDNDSDKTKANTNLVSSFRHIESMKD